MRKILLIVAALMTGAWGSDFPQWGRDNSRNMVCAEKNLPVEFDPGKVTDTGAIDLKTTKGVKWVAKLGSQTYGNPVVAGGKVLVGTNNESPRDRRVEGDRGVLMCFDEATGKFLWQLTSPKIEGGKWIDYEMVGICCPPTVEKDRVYIVTNRCEVMCLDLNGMANGNDGPFKDEAKYTGVEPRENDADILWRYDMRAELGISTANATSGSILMVGDRLYLNTSNGMDEAGKKMPSPDAPALICLDKNTGKLLAQENSGISARTFHANWSSPAYFENRAKAGIVFGGGDGFCYAFDTEPGSDKGKSVLKELWRCDCNPPEHRKDGDKPIAHTSSKGPSEIIATPVVSNNRIYVAVGQEPSSGDGVGCLNCIDAISGEMVWRNTEIERSISTVAIEGDLLYTADVFGRIYCIDASSGKTVWTHDTSGKIWASPLVADGKVYLANESGLMTILATGKEKKVLGQIDFGAPIHMSAIAANGVLFVATEQNLYAIGK